MRIKCIGCDALARMIYLSAAHSPHLVDVTMLRLGLHRQPADLQVRLQHEIDQAAGQGYDAVVMVYGLCGRATVGITARDVPVVVPRAHDCITLFLGSRARYSEQHEKTPGTYWYSLDYIERGSLDGSLTALGADGIDNTWNIEEEYDRYVAKYGKDNADYLMEVMGAWRSHYNRAAFIDMGIGDNAAVEGKARDEASRRGWNFERVAGDLVMVRQLLNGDWNEDYLVLQPGQRLGMSYDENVIRAE
ncbi:MAG: DUF1638 domain-containing protein [Anaerolineaceae bacterium]|nr:DUF1638 domain-containing protein [Anaerolineaceae bacterium]